MTAALHIRIHDKGKYNKEARLATQFRKALNDVYAITLVPIYDRG